MAQGKLTRRQFLRSALASATGALAASTYARAQGANEKIHIGVIGCGGRGTYLARQVYQFAKQENVEITAVCDVWRKNLEAMARRVKQWWGREPRQFQRFAELLALEDIDAVIIATPDFAHSPILAAALRAGKDAYVEKPMASRLEDANDALAAWEEKKDRVVQVGTQRRSDGRHAAAAKLIQSGILGKISKCESSWNDCNPRWHRGAQGVFKEDVDWEQFLMYLPKRPWDAKRFRMWHLYKDYTVGTPGLLGAHTIDLIHWYMDDPLPKNCVANGGIYVWKEDREHADTVCALYEYPKGFLAQYETRLGNSYHIAEAVFYGTRGMFDTSSWKARGTGGGKDKLKEEVAVKPLPSVNHMLNFLQCLRSRKQPNATIQMGYAHSIASIMAFRALETGERQVFDPEKREIRPG